MSLGIKSFKSALLENSVRVAKLPYFCFAVIKVIGRQWELRHGIVSVYYAVSVPMHL